MLPKVEPACCILDTLQPYIRLGDHSFFLINSIQKRKTMTQIIQGGNGQVANDFIGIDHPTIGRLEQVHKATDLLHH